tara:strand:- start:1928 stop:2608 length:681 start_codon:yes stop_codon:yes gene_type:complete
MNNNLLEIYNNSYNNENIYFIINLPIIFIFDRALITFFGKKARWFQLHVICNLWVTYEIYNDVILIYKNPLVGYKYLPDNKISYIIFWLHFYHFLLFNNLKFIDYFHHVLFVIFGIIPSIRFIRTNQIFLGYIACSGIPGVFEYSLLFLFKHNMITMYSLKKCIYYLYLYFRLPLCLIGCGYNISSLHSNIVKDNIYISYYINLLLFINGTLFTQLVSKSYYNKLY